MFLYKTTIYVSEPTRGRKMYPCPEQFHSWNRKPRKTSSKSRNRSKEIQTQREEQKTQDIKQITTSII